MQIDGRDIIGENIGESLLAVKKVQDVPFCGTTCTLLCLFGGETADDEPDDRGLSRFENWCCCVSYKHMQAIPPHTPKKQEPQPRPVYKREKVRCEAQVG